MRSQRNQFIERTLLTVCFCSLEPWPDVAAFITSCTDKAFHLRQSSPFAGILSPLERKRIYETFRP